MDNNGITWDGKCYAILDTSYHVFFFIKNYDNINAVTLKDEGAYSSS